MKKQNKPQKTILLDTSVYGELIIDSKTRSKIQKQISNKKIIIYGNKVIRNELRDLSKKSKLGRFSKRVLLLNLFDDLVQDHMIIIGELIELLAKNYFKKYKELQGKLRYGEIRNDFLIVASASIKELDIVLSHDTKSMLSKVSIQAYKFVNKNNGLRNPRFIRYEEYKKSLDFIDLSI